MATFERFLHQAGVTLPTSHVLLILIGGSMLLAIGADVLRGRLAAMMVIVACPLLVWRTLAASRDRRVLRFDLQLPAALDLVIGQLRAHRSVAEAIAEVAQRASDPLRGEFIRIAEESRFGAPLAQTLDGWRKRTPSRALGAIVTAILVTDRTGGNLAEFLSRQSQVVRAQVAFRQEVRALTAHARSTAAFLTLLPVGIALALYALNPGFFAPMVASRPGRALLVCAAAMEASGWQVIRSMVRSVER